MRQVKFIRMHATADGEITQKLKLYYADGWRVVSHTDSDSEYSFVLEREDGK